MTDGNSRQMPQRLMSQVFWAFRGSPFESRQEFDERVAEYHVELHKPWKSDEVVLATARVVVTYMCWEEADDDDDDEEQEEYDIEITSDNGRDFTAGELLFKIHNAVVADLSGVDHHFFEGLMYLGTTTPAGVPVYHLDQGS